MATQTPSTPEGPSRPTRKGARTRQRILDAAAVLLDDRGPAGLAMADIAARAGMSKASTYYYFADCDQIVYEVVVGELRTMVAAFERAAATAVTAREALDRIAASFVGLLRQNRQLVRFVMGSLQTRVADGGAEEREHLRDRLLELLSTQIERGKTEGSVRTDMDAGFGASAILGLFLSSAGLNPRSADGEERLLDSLRSFIAHGMGAPNPA